MQKFNRIQNSLRDLWALLMQYPGGQVPRGGQVPMSKPKCFLSMLCQPPRENLDWHLQPQPWPQEIVTSPKQLIVTAREPDARSLLQWEGRALFYLFPQTPGPALLPEKKNITPCKRSPGRGFLEQLAGPALEEPHKKSRIKPWKTDAFLFIQ